MIFPWFERTFASLTGRLLAQRLHHALLLAGPPEIGKFQLADALAQVILCQQPASVGSCGHCQSCKLFAAGSHPDFHMLESDKQLGVDKIREGIARLSGTAQLSRNKVLVIPAAHTMTDSAANALLKTLEEPTDNTFLLLLTEKPQQLLPTILSRCEKCTLPVPGEAESLNWLKAEGVEDASGALLQAYGGSPLAVRRALSEEDTALSYRGFQDGIQALLSGAETSLALASRWQDAAPQVVTWCQQQAHRRYISTQQVQDFEMFSLCQHAAKRLQHPGINKVVVLCQVLELLQRPAPDPHP
ncbi:DNA polymerase III subunit delta' [Alteromonas sp. ASW11-19]|uniref:DNA-directed DNA polymerase n=1 Tax=Alteromonas salexigens TaxID=2982530 RepID=A0ABT2VKZ2_9ALTE|nr:DNA polymerase III subunit delta' [Alteromonas salexigens]MCU7553968.1 DNA polymerase III subunit delta' [Alteromonas salexigens]